MPEGLSFLSPGCSILGEEQEHLAQELSSQTGVCC